MRAPYLFALPFALASAKHVTNLSETSWTLSNDALNISVPGSLPSQAHLDLFAAGVIGDPYYDLNDFNLRWVVWHNWTYSAVLSGLSRRSNSSSNSSTWLQFNGLDTFAEISLCGRHVASTNNQFRQWWFDVSEIVAACGEEETTLELEFESAPVIANGIAEEPGAETWPYGVQQVFEFTNRWFIRKEQSDFGWDWGPAMAPAGPWQPAFVVELGSDEVHIRNSDIDIYREGQLNLMLPDQSKDWAVNASLDYIGHLPQDAKLSYILEDANNATIMQGSLANVNCTRGAITGSVIVPSDAVELWWPNGLGPQNLYYLTVSIDAKDNVSLATIVKRTGFRTIVLNEFPITQAQLDQGIAPGSNWHFEINGHEMYAKGSNFIPPDAFWPRVTVEKMSQLFDSVVDGNQQMLRVWASGAYSPDFLYDLADERGILLWSEFEFGDALYPIDNAFLENVREEAEYNVRRVNHHPSLALWAGGNELESLELPLVNRSAPEELERYRREYETLFLDTLVPAVFENSRSISYTPSSTSNGGQSLDFNKPIPITQRYDNLTSGSVYGETDFYNYNVSVLYNDSAYPVGRFSNEFGFHSMPSIHSWRQQVSEEYLSFNSSVVMLRDHHPPPGGLNTSNYANASIGQAQMTEGVELWYPISNKTDPIANFSAWCHATQIFQADLYVSQIQFYRRGSGLPNRQLGSLYWQLEDIWVAPTWSSVEYDGRWKILHYAAKDVYEPIIIAPYYNITTGNLSVWVTSDLWDPIQGTVSFEWYDWSGTSLDVNTTSSKNFSLGAINSTQVLQTSTKELLQHQDPRNAILKMSVTAEGNTPNSHITRTFEHESWFHPTALKDAALVDPGLVLEYSETTRNFTVRATTGVAAWVWLEHGPGVLGNFDSNAFWLGHNESRQVSFKVKNDTTGGKWVGEITVQSLWNQTLQD